MNLMIFVIFMMIEVGIGISGKYQDNKKWSKNFYDVQVICLDEYISVNFNSNKSFSGLIFPKELPAVTPCTSTYLNAISNFSYTLGYRNCSTMRFEREDEYEFINVLTIQPHAYLITSQLIDVKIHCRKPKKETIEIKTMVNQNDYDDYSANEVQQSDKFNKPFDTISKPIVKYIKPLSLAKPSMKIFLGRPEENIIGQEANVGQLLTLQISMPNQSTYGLKIKNCVLGDGVSRKNDFPVINNDGCPLDEDIWGPFEYSKDLTVARVSFKGVRFPSTYTVIYQCQASYCLKSFGMCQMPCCDKNGACKQQVRRKRDANNSVKRTVPNTDVELSEEIYTGMYIFEEGEKPFNMTGDRDTDLLSTLRKGLICFSPEKLYPALFVGVVLLAVAIFMLIYCSIRRRHRKNTSTGSSISIYSVFGDDDRRICRP